MTFQKFITYLSLGNRGCAVYSWGVGLECDGAEEDGCEDQEDYDDAWCVPHEE